LISESKTSLPNCRREEICFGPWTVCICVEWILNFVQETGVRTDLYKRVGSTQQILFQSVLICETKTGPLNYRREAICFGPWTVCICVEWILNFVQETGVRTDLYKRVGSTQQILFLSFLICETKTGPLNYRREEICFGPWTVCMRGMDLELCTRDGCKK